MKQKYNCSSNTVDLIVFLDGGIVLIKRKNEPFRNYWALPGGFLDHRKETLEEAGVRELREETSLVASVDNLKLMGVYSDPERDPRGHVVSHVYEVFSVTGALKANDDAKEVKIFRELPENLAFDHRKILDNHFLKGGTE